MNQLSRVVKSILAVCCAVGVGVVSAPAASADGLHIWEEQGVWKGGCTVSFYIKSDGIEDWRESILEGNARIREQTGIKFVELTDSRWAGSADIVYQKFTPEQVKGLDAVGLASGKDVWLLQTDALDADGQYLRDKTLRTSTAAHETMHILGLDHDDDKGTPPPDEVMNGSDGIFPVVFGKGDRTGLDHIAEVNGCSPGRDDYVPGLPAAKMVGYVPKFGPKKVTMLIPTRSVYNVRTGKTTVVTAERKTVMARSNGINTWVRDDVGEWFIMPYVYKPRTNTLVYNEAMRLRLALDPRWYWGAVPRYVGR